VPHRRLVGRIENRMVEKRIGGGHRLRLVQAMNESADHKPQPPFIRRGTQSPVGAARRSRSRACRRFCCRLRARREVET
jgi:hypothetical protein